jgi:membrane-associated phospholipid phosphatase
VVSDRLCRTYDHTGNSVITNGNRLRTAPRATCNVEGVRNQQREATRAEPPRTTAQRQPASRGNPWAPLSRTHKALFIFTTAVYLAVIVAVLTTSRLVSLDWDVMLYKPYEHWPRAQSFLNSYVVLGQRGPSAIVATVWLAWRSWRSRSWRPLLVLGVSLVLLNMTVGAVKIGMGRLGPHYAHVIDSSALFQGGGIFPSGHTANAVVTWGVLAYLAVRHRRLGAALAGLLAITVGLTTVYLGTHWVTDVLAGWAAGVLVLLILPLFEPVIATADGRMRALWARRRNLRGDAAIPPQPVWMSARETAKEPDRRSVSLSAPRTNSTG